ncbi:MAG: MFS transporter [Actinomycetota bacterium]|nr:MFS transporter [Actinomycetota bacterium]
MNDRYRWVVLGLGIFAQTAFAAVIQGIAAVGPALRRTYDLSLPELGFVLAALSVGTAITLIPWGLVTDRFGERMAISVGLAGCTLSLVLASRVDDVAFLAALFFAAGVLGGVTSVASGRAVMSWFAASERGTALGLRQTAVPLGGALGALALPPLVVAAGLEAGLLLLAGACGAAALACGTWLRGRARSEEGGDPGAHPMRDRRIWRLGGAACLLVFSQISFVAFVVVFLVEERGMSPTGAGLVLGAAHVLGAAMRVAVGRWSDRLGHRVRPLRRLSATMVVLWACVTLVLDVALPLFIVVLVAAGAFAISWNGLAFTAAAEYAGTRRSGTAIGLQQTILFAGAAIVAPAFGALVEAAGWRSAFAALALCPLVAWFVLGPLVARNENLAAATKAS